MKGRRDARAEQRDVVRRYAYQHRKDLLALLRTPLGEVRVFPLAIVRMERGHPFELRPICGVSASVEQTDRRHEDTGGVLVVVTGPDFQWRLTLPPPPGASRHPAGAAQQFAAAVTTAARSSDTSGAATVHDGQGGPRDVRADPRQLA